MSAGFRFSRAWSMARKETKHVRRDPFTLATALGLPILLVVFFGYAIDFNVKDIHVIAADRDNTRSSREFLKIFTSSRFFNIEPAGPGHAPQRALDTERAKGVIIIEPGLGNNLAAGRPAAVQVLLDGADNSTTGIISGYLIGIQQAAWKKFSPAPLVQPIKLQTRFLFNQEQNSRWFVVPGLIVVVIGTLSILLTALTVAREWETGSMELLLSTPVRPLEIIFGKLAPYLGLVLAGVGMVYLIARLQFGLPFRGSHLLFLAGILLFLCLCLAQGLLISVITRQQQLAMQLSFISGLLPTLLLSGFIFPIESMPPFFQYLTYILAPRWCMIVSRGIFLKGTGLTALAQPLLMLLLLNIIFVGLALKRFKKDLEP